MMTTKPVTTKTQALARAKRAQAALNQAMTKAAQAADTRDAAIKAAQDAGATYPEIQAATDLSTARVTQVLRRMRIQEN